MKAALVLFITLGLPALATADVVVPIDSVRQFVNIRAEATAESYVIGRLYQGDNVLLVEPGTGWHEIEIEPDLNGFISADWATVVTEAELAAAVAKIAEEPEPPEPAPVPVTESTPDEVVEEAPLEVAAIDQSAAEPPVEAE